MTRGESPYDLIDWVGIVVGGDLRRGKEVTMKREMCKFLSGSFAALAYAHAAYAVATSSGIVNEPVFLGRRWGVGYMWTEAAVYTAVSVALGYLGWISKPQEQLENSTATPTNGQRKPVEAGKPAEAVSR